MRTAAWSAARTPQVQTGLRSCCQGRHFSNLGAPGSSVCRGQDMYASETLLPDPSS